MSCHDAKDQLLFHPRHSLGISDVLSYQILLITIHGEWFQLERAIWTYRTSLSGADSGFRTPSTYSSSIFKVGEIIVRLAFCV